MNKKYKIPAMDARNTGKSEKKPLRIAVVGLTRDEIKKEFNAKQLNNKDRDIFTDGVNAYFYVNDELPNTHGRMFDKVYDLRLLKSETTFDLMSRLSNYPDGYYIGREMYELVFVQKVLERVAQQEKEIEELKQSQKQLVIEKLETLKTEFNSRKLEYISNLTKTHCYGLRIDRIFEIIDDQIKELKGE